MSAASGELATVLAFPVPHSDVGLVTGLRVGQADAVRALCERYGAEMLRVAMRVLGPSANLRSLVGEAVSQAVATIDQLDDPRTLRHWLINHLLSAVLRHLRARRRWSFVPFFRGGGSLLPNRGMLWASGVSESELGHTCSQRTIDTYRVLDALKDNERIALCLACFDGMEPSEIAMVLGTSVARVRRLLEHAEAQFERVSSRL